MAEKLYVLIPTAGRSALLERTLASLARCEKPATYEATVVVENGSKGEAEAVVRKYQERLKARYIHVPLANKSHALNEALSMIESGLVFFTDDDVRLHPRVLCAYSAAAEGVSGGRFFGGPTGVDYEREPPAWLKVYLPPSARGWGLNGGPAAEQWRFFLGFNWAAFAEDIRAAGGFDPNFGPGSPTGSRGQEENMEKRLLALGVEQVFVAEAMVWHYVPEERCSPKWIIKRAYQSGIRRGSQYKGELKGPLGYPSKMIRRWLRHVLRAAKWTLQRDPVTRLDAYYQLAQHTGYLRGCRLRKSLDHGKS